MGARFRSWWQTIRKLLVAIVIIVACALGIALIVGIIGGYLYHWVWTGITTKTLWDWLNLLGVLAIPVVVGFGAAWFTTKQTQASEAANKRQHDTELEISTDNQREAALQAYIDNISELLLDKNLRESAENNEVRNIARVRTLTVLSRLDDVRKRTVLQFLHESGLIAKGKSIIDLHGADFRQADLGGAGLLSSSSLDYSHLEGANLSFADLRGADLRGADLGRANLEGTQLCLAHLEGAWLLSANLRGADLKGAFLDKAHLRQTDLTEARVTMAQLNKAKSLQGAILPDGSIHP